MTRCARVFVVLSLIAIFAGVSALYAVWEENGVLVCGMANDYYGIGVTEAGEGGIIIAWKDERAGNSDIYAARLDPYGNTPWTPNGVPVCTQTGYKGEPLAVSDGEGGAIIIWRDSRVPETAVYAQRIDSTGTALWTAGGDSIFTVINSLNSMTMIPDGAGGAIVLWSDYRNGNYDIFAQRIDGNGSRLWTWTGLPVCTFTGNQFTDEIVTAGGGEFIIVIRDNRSGNDDIYAQKIDTTGTLQWNADGLAVCTHAELQASIAATSDDAGGAIVAWIDSRSGDAEVYAQRILPDGNTAWTADGIPVADGTIVDGPAVIVTDSEGGAIIIFTAGSWTDYHVFAQRVDGNGSTQWWPGGVRVSTGYWDTWSESVCPDGEGGAIVLIHDERDMSATSLFAQRLDHDGIPRWAPGGIPVFSMPGENVGPDDTSIMSDGSGKAYCVWTDDRNDDYNLFGSQVNIYGGIGEFNDLPAISSIDDVPNDQGGRMILRWLASPADTFPNAPVEYYSAWRLLPDGGAVTIPAFGLEDIGMEAEFSGEAVRRIPTAAGDAWEFIGNVPARQAEEYALLVESLYDSMGTDPGWQYFVVTAHLENSALYFDSPVDSGYSVDNLSPALPVAFEGIQSLTPPGLRVYWELGTESDLGHYEVYKGPAEDFVPGVSNLVGNAADTELLDPDWTPADEDFFKLIAVDVHGNRGPAALLRPENIYVGTLLQNFSASWTDSWIELKWTLSQVDDGIEFHVLRADGRGGRFEEIEGPHLDGFGLTFVLEDHSCEPGVIYVYRVDVEESGSRRVLFETEELKAPTLPLTLHQNVPNPFNPSTSIAFYLPERSHIRIDVYDVAGRLVTTLVDETRPGGQHTVEWNGSDASGRTAASGVYFYRLVAGKFEQIKKMILLR